MHDTFSQASNAAPCVVLIDEMDSFCSRELGSNDYSDKVVNALLEKLDGPSRKPGTIVIGTTNNLKKVDPALMRPGRFSEIFRIDLPTGPERLIMAGQYLDSPIPEDVTTEFLDATDEVTSSELAVDC